MADFTTKHKAELQASCPEVRNLPDGWTFEIPLDHGIKQVAYVKAAEGISTYGHPTLGHLPQGWILRLALHKDGSYSLRYHNEETKEWTTRDPRLDKRNLEQINQLSNKDLRVASSAKRMVPSKSGGLSHMMRKPPLSHNVRDQYEVLHTIDPGDGSKGGMNSGVFVVRSKSNISRVYIEKRFQPKDFPNCQDEINMLYRVKHHSLTMYILAFVTPGPKPEASIYVEFCDRGDLDGVLKAYAKHPGEVAPEAFVWHNFIGLTEGLAYLQGGDAATSNPPKEDKKWIPILHRDMKPDNILFRSRSTLGSSKYFYCVISDFGIAGEERAEGDPKQDVYQKSGAKMGTVGFQLRQPCLYLLTINLCTYFAPEMLNDPYPKTDADKKQFPNGFRHSAKSDLWSLGASMYNLCFPKPSFAGSSTVYSHMDMKTRPKEVDTNDWFAGTSSRVYPLNIPAEYSEFLREAVLLATTWDPGQRPDPITMLGHLRKLVKKSGFEKFGSNLEPLPEWATRVHEYFGKAEIELLKAEAVKAAQAPPEEAGE